TTTAASSSRSCREGGPGRGAAPSCRDPRGRAAPAATPERRTAASGPARARAPLGPGRFDRDHPLPSRMIGARPLLVVLGTTASGKSEIAVRLAERFGGEIVGCDSMQVYRGFVLGTGAPGPELRARAPHHLIGVADPAADFSLGEYVRLAAASL